MITTRRASPEDASTIGHMVDALLVELGGQASRLDERTATARRLLQDNRAFGLLALDNSQAVGALMLSENASIYAGGCFGVITELYVQPQHRSAGVARQLVQAAASLGRERGWRLLEVGAPPQPKWQRSLDFYLREGFSVIGPRLKHPL